MTELACNICGNTDGNHRFTVLERMFGTLDEFEYIGCSMCGHIHLAKVPNNMDRYYPKAYYSFSPQVLPGWWRWLNKARTKAMLGSGQIIGKVLLSLKKPWYGNWLSAMGLRPGNCFLDVGCGIGNFIRELQAAGLKCTGIDPFLPQEMDTSEGVCLRKRSIEEEWGKYNGILFSHSLEHIPDPARALSCAHNCLAKGGRMTIRIPVADSLAFWRYGANWFQLDAPRHLNLFTQKSLRLLAERTGFEIVGIWYDSRVEQFWQSEEYRMGICKNDSRSYGLNRNQSHFSPKTIAKYRKWTKWVNEMGIGDQAAFVLQSRNIHDVTE